MEPKFKISSKRDTVVLEKEGKIFSVGESLDNDIWFTTSLDKLTLELSLSSRIYAEWQTYFVFERLMQSIIGRYILRSQEARMLPEDFIDFDNKIITWHSDSSLDNVLQLKFENDNIQISILKAKEAKSHNSNAVRIRVDGSEYSTYHQEFAHFYKELQELENKLNPYIENVHQDGKAPYQKKI